VSGDDFPSTDVVRCRLEQFEKKFVSAVIDKYNSLSVGIQLSCLSIAVSNSQQILSLADYLQLNDNSPQLPVDFLDQCAAGCTNFTPCVPPAMFPGITHARKLKVILSQYSEYCLQIDFLTLIILEPTSNVAHLVIKNFDVDILVVSGCLRVRIANQ